MKTIQEMQSFEPILISYDRIQHGTHRPTQFLLKGELGYRLKRAAERIEEQLPYSREYLLSQVSGAQDEWSNFPRVHGDIAGRWVLAETYLHSAKGEAPEILKDIVDGLLELQNADGSFGIVSFEEEPLNMHKAYGNGWMMKALPQYAITFDDERVKQAAIRLGEFYERTFPLWVESNRKENETKFYAISISCYYHAFDGILSLYKLTKEQRWLDLLAQFIPQLTPLEKADHSHMYLTIRRGILNYYRLLGNETAIQQLADEAQRCYQECLLETGGVPERFWLKDGEHADDEGCSLFDWELLTLGLHESTQESYWMDYAILNLENHIFYNQTYNGGFGSCELGECYKQQGKEAPWCCSVFGPFGLADAASAMVHFDGKTAVVHHLVTGTFLGSDGQKLSLVRDDEKGIYSVTVSGITAVKIYTPHWLDFAGNVFGEQDGDQYCVSLGDTQKIDLHFQYRLWMSNKGKSPRKLDEIQTGTPFVLFYGPWMLTHRYQDGPIQVDLNYNGEGYISNFKQQFMRGCGFYGETIRIVLPCTRKIEPTDVFCDVYESDGELYLYPLKDKESPNQGNSTVYAV